MIGVSYEKDEKQEHDDGYEATAIAAVAGILQLLDGSIEEPGVIIMGHGVNANRYLADIKRLGMKVQIKQSRVDCIEDGSVLSFPL